MHTTLILNGNHEYVGEEPQVFGGKMVRWRLLYSKLTGLGCSLIQRDRLKLGGAGNIDGMRITPETIVEHYEGGFSVAEIANEIFPGVTQEQIRTILKYASEKGYLDRFFAA